MERATMNDLRARRLAGLSSKDRAEFDAAYERARLAIEVGEQVRAREAAELTQRELATRVGTSQAAIARLEAGSTAPTLTTLQKVASVLELDISVELTAPEA